mmetsp:Transcript_20543/g.65441  ORF Transcript_20543/g.65441 Transcript_20543/m.65441 type:complete len:378 (-) Transcript_20543:1496-2629(-)
MAHRQRLEEAADHPVPQRQVGLPLERVVGQRGGEQLDGNHALAHRQRDATHVPPQHAPSQRRRLAADAERPAARCCGRLLARVARAIVRRLRQCEGLVEEREEGRVERNEPRRGRGAGGLLEDAVGERLAGRHLRQQRQQPQRARQQRQHRRLPVVHEQRADRTAKELAELAQARTRRVPHARVRVAQLEGEPVRQRSGGGVGLLLGDILLLPHAARRVTRAAVHTAVASAVASAAASAAATWLAAPDPSAGAACCVASAFAFQCAAALRIFWATASASTLALPIASASALAATTSTWRPSRACSLRVPAKPPLSRPRPSRALLPCACGGSALGRTRRPLGARPRLLARGVILREAGLIYGRGRQRRRGAAEERRCG